MNLGIVGSRRRNDMSDLELVRYWIQKLKPDKIISGGCAIGTDYFAEMVAKELGIPIRVFHPEFKGTRTRWDFTKACYERNEKIAMHSDMLLALVAEDRKGGTENTIRFFEEYHGKEGLIILEKE